MKSFIENLRDRFNFNFKAAVTPVKAFSYNSAVNVSQKIQNAAMTISARYNLIR